MRKDTTHEAEERADEFDTTEYGDGHEQWPDNYPSETIHAVPVDEVTAGVDVTLYDFDEVGDDGEPPMFEIKENYPPEDDVDEESAVYFHGGHAAMQVISAIAYLWSQRYPEEPHDDE